jgi:Fe-S-cluster-containing dehydrogenase component
MDPRRCVACGHCENVCAFRQSNDFDRHFSSIRVNHYPEQSVCLPLTCVHCTVAWCMEVCPAGAIARNPETRAAEIDPARCIGCKMCMLACPFGAVHFDPRREVCIKCDLCGGDPQCVKHCFPGALRFEAEEELHRPNRSRVDRLLFATLDKGGRSSGGETGR